jgi:hypothetical protein
VTKLEEVRSIRWRRADSQLLSGRESQQDPSTTVSHLLAVQAQDLRAARLALRARNRSLTAAGVNHALTTERSLLVAWLGRGTLHLVHRNDYQWLIGLTGPTRLTTNRRRLTQEGVTPRDAKRAISVIENALSREGPLTRQELAARMSADGIRTEGQATPHLLLFAALRGVLVLGPLKVDGQAFVLTEDWLGARPRAKVGESEREGVLSELARRYLRSHGPASPEDLATWAGLPLRDARAGFESIAPELVDEGGLSALAGRNTEVALPPPNLLPAFDPYLLGWKDRGFAVAETHRRRVHPGGGILRSVVLVDGAAAGTWSIRRGREKTVTIDIDPFAPLTDEVVDALHQHAFDVARFEGVTLNG